MQNLNLSNNDYLEQKEIPSGYYEIIRDAFKNNNFRLVEIMLDRIPFDDIFPHNNQPLDYHNCNVKWFSSKEVFNFLFERSRKAGKADKIISMLRGSRNLEELCQYSTIKQFRLVAKKIRKDSWFLKNTQCLTEAITSNNYLIVKELIKIVKSRKIANVEGLVRYNISSYAICKWFLEETTDLRSLTLIKKEFPEIDFLNSILDHLEKQIIDNAYYRNKDEKENLFKKFKKIIKFFKLKTFNFYSPISLLKALMFDHSLFFFVYKRISKEDIHHIYSERPILELLNFKDSYSTRIHPKVAKFLLKKNLQLLTINKF